MSKIKLHDIANGDFDDSPFEKNQPSVNYDRSEFNERNENSLSETLRATAIRKARELKEALQHTSEAEEEEDSLDNFIKQGNK
jgi:hypothetical protein